MAIIIKPIGTVSWWQYAQDENFSGIQSSPDYGIHSFMIFSDNHRLILKLHRITGYYLDGVIARYTNGRY